MEGGELWLATSSDRRVSVWASDWLKDKCELLDWLSFPAPAGPEVSVAFASPCQALPAHGVGLGSSQIGGGMPQGSRWDGAKESVWLGKSSSLVLLLVEYLVNAPCCVSEGSGNCSSAEAPTL